jgi:hypothetical protein
MAGSGGGSVRGLDPTAALEQAFDCLHSLATAADAVKIGDRSVGAEVGVHLRK